MGTVAGRIGAAGPSTESSTAVQKAGVGRCPSIDVTSVDDAVDYHLIAKISDLWPRPENPEEEDDLTETLRSSLRVAITEILVGYKIRVVVP